MADIQAHYTSPALGNVVVGLYIDGELKAIGPQDEVLNKAIQLMGVKQVFSSDFMLGTPDPSQAAKTIQQIVDYKSRNNQNEAAALRQKAAELLQLADEIQGI